MMREPFCCVECGAHIVSARTEEWGTGVFAPDGVEERTGGLVYTCANGHRADEAEEAEGDFPDEEHIHTVMGEWMP